MKSLITESTNILLTEASSAKAAFADFINNNKGNEGSIALDNDGDEIKGSIYLGDGQFVRKAGNLVTISKVTPKEDMTFTLTKQQFDQLRKAKV
tara:strand:+ start:3627 stop:3908 length:282 start_codon:yes stop_codon:yes gene_type:complete